MLLVFRLQLVETQHLDSLRLASVASSEVLALGWLGLPRERLGHLPSLHELAAVPDRSPASQSQLLTDQLERDANIHQPPL